MSDRVYSLMGKQRVRRRLKSKRDQGVVEKNELYDLSTPLWDRYQRQVRRSIKFPRYYRKQDNW